MQNNILNLARSKSISISELARRIDMEPHTLRRYTRGETEPKSDLALKLADVFGCMPSEVLGLEPVGDPIGKMPLYGPVAAGHFNGQTCMDKAVDHIGRPSFLISKENAYAVFVVGESMEPRFKAGEVLFVDPDAPIRQGSDVVVQINLDENYGELTAVTKEFKSWDNDTLTLHQLNPDKLITIARNQITAIHSVQGTWMRM